MTEAAFQIKFSHWAKAKFKGSGAFELKLVKNSKSLPFSTVKDHQLAALTAANSTEQGLFWKIMDCGYINPMDSFIIRNTPAYIVVQFWKPREKIFYMIPVKNFIAERYSSRRKSLTEERALAIGIKCSL